MERIRGVIGGWHPGQLAIVVGLAFAAGVSLLRSADQAYDSAQSRRYRCESRAWETALMITMPDTTGMTELQKLDAGFHSPEGTPEYERLIAGCRNESPVLPAQIGVVASLLLLASTIPILWIWFGARRGA